MPKEKDQIVIDFSEEGAAVDREGFIPSSWEELQEYATESNKTVRQLYDMARVADNRGVSGQSILPTPKQEMLTGGVSRLATAFKSRMVERATASGKSYKGSVYTIDSTPTGRVSVEKAADEGVYEKSVEYVPESDIPKAIVESLSDEAVRRKERYIKSRVVGHVKERLYDISAAGESAKAKELCDWLISEVKSIRKDL